MTHKSPTEGTHAWLRPCSLQRSCKTGPQRPNISRHKSYVRRDSATSARRRCDVESPKALRHRRGVASPLAMLLSQVGPTCLCKWPVKIVQKCDLCRQVIIRPVTYTYSIINDYSAAIRRPDHHPTISDSGKDLYKSLRYKTKR